MKSITFTIYSERQQIPLVRACISALCREAGFDEKSRFETELSAGEALNKIVEQAVRDGRCGEVFLTWTRGDGRLIMEIKDRGTPISIASDTHDGTASSPDTHGGGGPILLSLMDEVSYESDNGINRLRMIRVLGQPQSSQVGGNPP